MFAEFLRERVAKLTPDEHRIIDLINRITALRGAFEKEPGLSEFIDSELGQAQNYAENAFKSFRAGDINNAKALFRAANAYFDGGQGHAKRIRRLHSEIAELLDSTQN
jgi:hypothetical protein